MNLNIPQIIAIIAVFLLCWLLLLFSIVPSFVVLPVQIFMAFLLVALAKQLQIQM